ncbi:biotin--[acetyl-CoA-carboxylase] ligase [Aurantiacibacter gangjinensis]|uniref:biotin--[biotin carboxyl-carrier protein] ligase n=1 Tax=Aurantiacibacter gangjinensis TaxID=502682 RepID=A0A0G9MQF9_9SPHN|nr:biotin--[acetyl-CoA-carboxylase] ligase [Aurantiacibacter gangjinensis]APE28823.1 Biotin-protein ligase [Aurantiacibacter gangjinensis]KLE32971.1 biotin--protein ligase [Aurantiacibacter gangjinensis]
MIETVAETGSTNADLLARLARGDAVPDGHWLVAQRQTAGRGRQGRAWLDGEGNFTGSTVVNLEPPFNPPPETLSFVAALAVYETVLPLLPDPGALRMKWPNDVLLAGAKFCGLLLERHQQVVVIGIGVNLASAPEIEDRVVSALSDSAKTPPLDTFARTLAQQFAIELARWWESGHEPILRRWAAAAHPVGSRLRVHAPDGEIVSGTFAALGDTGALLLRLPDGATTAIHAGDVMLEND